MLLKFNDTLYNVGTYKFIPILMILMFAEVIKLSFSLFYNDPYSLTKIDSRLISGSRTKKSWTKVLKEILKFLVLIFIISIIYYIIIVLFGAPLSTHHEETTMLTVTLSTLTFVPPCLHLGVDIALPLLTGDQPFKNNIVIEAMSRNIKLTLLGTWLGAIVLPLDWDRPWQVWPIPCVIGALIGYMIAHYITLIKVLPIIKFWKFHKKVHR
ncbi:hypothetical protein PV325_001441 [Microctonus aethiopoides]|uniref:Phosphatidylinositol-glycan biosynthesis class F protein n=1 Tax=Microctonus aethiopoides TaxID=144406 RepID=A0AA39KJM3_9HYME|nr:hypothetical protein PV325_001441 [Microctonus aethiopoides]KAK0163943.1 hypothetical protein PV328_002624 [Microctonus aethiopoides]